MGCTLSQLQPTACRGFWCISSPIRAMEQEPLSSPPTRSLTSATFRLVKATNASTTSSPRSRAKNDSLACISADLLDCDGLLNLQVNANTKHDSGDEEPATAAAEFITSSADKTVKHSAIPTVKGPEHDSGDAGPAAAAWRASASPNPLHRAPYLHPQLLCLALPAQLLVLSNVPRTPLCQENQGRPCDHRKLGRSAVFGRVHPYRVSLVR